MDHGRAVALRLRQGPGSMHKPFSPSRLNRFRYRKSLLIGEGGKIAPSVTFSINRGSCIRLGPRCHISQGAILATCRGWIELGEDVSVNPYSILYGHGGLRIGNQVRIAAHCVIVPANHKFDRTDLPIFRQGQTRQGIVIGDDVWIGAHCTILDGAVIGSGAVIAAGAVVHGHVDPGSLYGGVPARKLKARGAPAGTPRTARPAPAPVGGLPGAGETAGEIV